MGVCLAGSRNSKATLKATGEGMRGTEPRAVEGDAHLLVGVCQHSKDIWFCYKCDGKPLEGFEQEQ